jgi:predicted PurR-regulated permease PerM
MARIVSFVVLLLILLAIFGLFFRVMADFLLPMFLAVLLVVIFSPLHVWIQKRCKNHDRVAAMLTTAAIGLIFFVPAAYILFQAAQEGGNLGKVIIYGEASDEKKKDAKPEPRDELVAEKLKEGQDFQKGLDRLASKVAKYAEEKAGIIIDMQEVQKKILEKAKLYLTPLAKGAFEFVMSFCLGFFVLVISLYYFLADGPAMIRAIMRLSPLDDKYEEQLIEQFGNVTRAMVVATLLSAVAQGLLAGVGFYFAGVESVFLLTVLAMLFAIIPFIGSAGVWVPVCLWIGFVDQKTWPAIILAVYCGAIVSSVDNLIKPWILHGRSNIHPLLALLSVLGGVQALGPIGIIVGPMAVAFLQTLLEMVNKEMAALSKDKSLQKIASTK